MCVYVCVRVCACVRAYEWVRVCVFFVCAYVRVSARVRAYVCACTYMCV